jgi:ubiquinone/menaquinone biosynthesis C-methylase UbiE
MNNNTVVKEYYETPGIAEAYGRRTSLLASEESILGDLHAELTGSSILDIGVGAGRTTAYLRELAGHYVGIDYSGRMLELCRGNHPDAELLHCDARALPFRDASFDAVFIPFNALDDVDHADRAAILAQTHRVLRENGLLVFSSHNRNAPRRSAFQPPRLVWSDGRTASLRRNAGSVVKYVRGIINRIRSMRHERREEEYAILNDQSYSYRLLAYYITPERQQAQLARHGFELLRMVGLDGRTIASGTAARDSWIYYVARRR